MSHWLKGSADGDPMKLTDWGLQRAVGFYHRAWFTRRGGDPKQASLRRELLRRFRRIDAAVSCLHSEKEMLVMVDFLLNHAPAGCMVECGSYQGGSSAKLSLVAAATGRKLYVCDSFEGLPSPEGAADSDFSDARWGPGRRFLRGEYAARRELVENNVRNLGNIEVCQFVEGFFSDSLPKLLHEEPLHPAFIFADVDLVSSTRDVLRNLWPCLAAGGRFYTHDANLVEFCEGIVDGAFWRDQLGEFPPVLFGAGHGLGFQAGAIAYCRKQ
jgi:O-methyltransferase